MPLRAIFFDFNGVLADDEPLHWRLFNETLAPYGIHVSFQEYKERLLGLDDRGVYKALLNNAGLNIKTDIEALIANKAARYAELAPLCVHAFPGTVRFLESLPNGIVCGIVSGALRSEVEMFLTREGLASFFQFVIAAEDTPEGKPDPSGYQKAFDFTKGLLKAKELKPRECLAIEDSLEGVIAAKKAGLKTLAVLNSYPASRLWLADIVLTDLSCWSFEEIESFFATNKNT